MLVYSTVFGKKNFRTAEALRRPSEGRKTVFFEKFPAVQLTDNQCAVGYRFCLGFYFVGVWIQYYAETGVTKVNGERVDSGN